MDDLRGPRGEYDWWASFTEAHPEIEDATLAALADAEREGSLPPPTEVTGPYVDPDSIPEEEHNQPDVTAGMTEEEVAAEVERLTRVHPRLIGHNGVVSVIAFGLNAQLRDMWIEAWDHYQDHGCLGGAQALDRLMEQLIAAFHDARAQTEGKD